MTNLKTSSQEITMRIRIQWYKWECILKTRIRTHRVTHGFVRHRWIMRRRKIDFVEERDEYHVSCLHSDCLILTSQPQVEKYEYDNEKRSMISARGQLSSSVWCQAEWTSSPVIGVYYSSCRFAAAIALWTPTSKRYHAITHELARRTRKRDGDDNWKRSSTNCRTAAPLRIKSALTMLWSNSFSNT